MPAEAVIVNHDEVESSTRDETDLPESASTLISFSYTTRKTYQSRKDGPVIPPDALGETLPGDQSHDDQDQRDCRESHVDYYHLPSVVDVATSGDGWIGGIHRVEGALSDRHRSSHAAGRRRVPILWTLSSIIAGGAPTEVVRNHEASADTDVYEEGDVSIVETGTGVFLPRRDCSRGDGPIALGAQDRQLQRGVTRRRSTRERLTSVGVARRPRIRGPIQICPGWEKHDHALGILMSQSWSTLWAQWANSRSPKGGRERMS